MDVITSRENPRIKRACALRDSEKQRAAAGLFFAEGPKLCLELARGCRAAELYATAPALAHTPALAALGPAVVEITQPVAEKLAGTRSTQGVFALFETPATDPAPLLATARRILALEAVQDPGNVGTLLRSAAAFGFDGVILSDGCAAPYAPKTLRASMGAAVRLPVIEAGAMPPVIAALRGRGIECLAAALYRSEPLSTARAGQGGVCIVIGSEGQGLTQQTIDACDRTVRIPMTDRVESLNAGIAGSILLWHFRGAGL